VEVSGDFEGYWAARPRNLKKNLRRYRNRMNNEIGPSRLSVSTLPHDVSVATDRYGLLESGGWKGGEGTALHPDNVQGEFYRTWMVEMAESSRAYVFELYVGDMLLASRLCVVGEGLLVIVKTTFNEEFKRYAVGRLLLHDTLEYIFQNGLAKVIDFYTDATEDQLDWATSSRSMQHCSVYRWSGATSLAKGTRYMKRLFSPRAKIH
jgi:hypothetical protein